MAEQFNYNQLASFGGPQGGSSVRQPVNGLQNFGFLDPHGVNFPQQRDPYQSMYGYGQSFGSAGGAFGSNRDGRVTIPNLQKPSMVDQAWLAFQNDYGRVQGANDQHYQDVGQAAGALGQSINSSVASLGGQLDSSVENLRGLAGQIPGMAHQGEGEFGSQLGALNRGIGRDQARINRSGDDLVRQADASGNAISQSGNKMLGDVTRDVNQSYGMGDKTLDAFGNYVNSTNQWSAAEAANEAGAIRHSAQTGLSQIKAATWSDMSPGERSNLLFQHARATDAQVQQAQTALAVKARDTLNSLKTTLASLGMDNAKMRQSGAAIKADAGKFAAGMTQAGEAMKVGARESRRAGDIQAAGTLGGLRGQAAGLTQEQAKIRQGWAQITQGFNTAIEQFQHASGLNIANMEIAGRDKMVAWADQNKQSIVSMFNGMTALLALASQPGTTGIPAARISNNG